MVVFLLSQVGRPQEEGDVEYSTLFRIILAGVWRMVWRTGAGGGEVIESLIRSLCSCPGTK